MDLALLDTNPVWSDAYQTAAAVVRVLQTQASLVFVKYVWLAVMDAWQEVYSKARPLVWAEDVAGVAWVAVDDDDVPVSPAAEVGEAGPLVGLLVRVNIGFYVSEGGRGGGGQRKFRKSVGIIGYRR